MNLGSGLAKINNLYIAPRYPQIPVTPVKKILGGQPEMPAIQKNPAPIALPKGKFPSGVSLTLPNGTFLVGYLIDIYA